MVIMTWNTDICVSLSLSRRENRIEYRNSSPIRKEMSLRIVQCGILAEIIVVIDGFCKSKVEM